MTTTPEERVGRDSLGDLAGRFPPGFAWGAATSAYQIEGAVDAGGRGPGIWDTYSHTPGRIEDGGTGDVACDHYHRLTEDLDLMRSLGLGAYRFSVAWPRIQPTGSGPANPAGLDFYDRLVDGLLERGIEPWLTLFHWDLPQPLEDAGGWPDREVVGRFADYTAILADRFGDRIRNWLSLNEPWCIAMLGYGIGRHAPGRQDWAAALRAAHHTHLAHRAAVDVIRSTVPSARIGIPLNLHHVKPASDTDADRAAARLHDGTANRWFLDPVLGRGYPRDIVEAFNPFLEGVDVSELDTETPPIDILGVNYYTRHVVRAVRDGEAVDGPEPTIMVDGGLPVTEMGWEVHADGLRLLLQRIQREYAPASIAITENGAAFVDSVGPEGSIADSRRVAYYRDHIAATADAIAAGVPVEAYFAWSLMDNFEWGFGYTKRFGIVHVDFETQRRTVKASGAWYRDLIAAAL
ncbi:MAG TPA: GH1 family beta-glucosidase [Candidatus Limnocylindria bacterium]|nr:GH1 family beta-glucosidase [Candidatus Limnocylindria bacterium]